MTAHDGTNDHAQGLPVTFNQKGRPMDTNILLIILVLLLLFGGGWYGRGRWY
jgi:hypothetical protein